MTYLRSDFALFFDGLIEVARLTRVMYSTLTMIILETLESTGLNIYGQKFQKVENDENRFFAITSSKLFKN